MSKEELETKRAFVRKRVGEIMIELDGQTRKRRGKKAQAFTVLVRVLDARSNYGRVDLLVEPVHGSGLAWVQETRVELRQ